MKDAPLNIGFHPQEPIDQVLESRRWLILMAVSLHICLNCVCWLTYLPILSAAQTYFQVEEGDILLFLSSYFFTFIAFCFIGSALASEAFQRTILGCMLLEVVGAWLRYAANGNYIIAIIGQFLIAAAAAPTFAFIKTMTNEWFSTKERIIVRIVIGSSACLGWILGFLLPTQIVSDNAEEIPLYELIQAIIIMVPLGIGAYYIRNKPEAPPSFIALVKSSEFPTFREEIKYLLSMPNFIWSATILSSSIGIGLIFPITGSAVFHSLGLSSIHLGTLGLVYIFGGCSARVSGELVLKITGEPNYDLIMKILQTLSLACLLILSIVVHVNSSLNLAVLYILTFFLGFGILGFVPLTCDSIGQSTFPVQELMSTNTALLVASVFAIAEVYLTNVNFVKKSEFFILLMMSIPCWIYVVFFHKTDYKRRKLEARNIEIENEFEKFYHDRRGFRSISPIRKKHSMQYFEYNKLSLFSKDLIMSTPITPLLKEPPQLPRSRSSDTFDQKKRDNANKLVELVEIT